MSDGSVRVGVLSLHESKETKAILNAIDALGHDTEWFREENTLIRVEDGRPAIEPVVDVVANRMLLSNTDQPAEELGIANALAGLTPTLNDPQSIALASHKVATAVTLATAEVPVPDTLLALGYDELNRHREGFGDVVVYKTAIGTHGGGTWRVESDEPISPRVGSRRAFLQELLFEEGERARDLRVYVVGDEVVGAMYRYAADNDWRTNVARGGSVEDATGVLPDGVADIAVTATNVVGLDYAGVDLIEGDDGWYVLEVNPTAGFRGLYRATGRSPAPYIAKLAIETAGGNVDEERVRELSATLDDSMPACAPVPDLESFVEPMVIGLTERVVVSGTSGNRTVIGKSDSGASRTSIDIRLAAEIGAGPIHTVRKVRTGSVKEAKTRPVVDLVIGIGGSQHTVEANIEDRGHMTHPLLLGRDILKEYHLDVSRRVEEPVEVPADREE